MKGEASVGRWLRPVQQAQSRALDFEDAYDLTGAQFSVLAAVVSNPGIDQRSVSVLTFVDKSTLADVVGRLVDRRLLKASRSPADGRRDHLLATSSAVSLIYEATPHLLRRNEAFLAVLPPAQKRRFLKALQSVGRTSTEQPPSGYIIPSPDGALPALDVGWGLGRPLRAAVQRYGRLWGNQISAVTFVQWLALQALTDGEEIDQRSLGEAISLDKASLTAMLGRLLRRELVTKSRDERDGRRRIIQLTARGVDLVLEVGTVVSAVEEQFLDPLRDRERADFVRALRALTEGLTVRGSRRADFAAVVADDVDGPDDARTGSRDNEEGAQGRPVSRGGRPGGGPELVLRRRS